MGPRPESYPRNQASDEKNEHMYMFPLFLSVFFTSTNVYWKSHPSEPRKNVCVCVCVCVIGGESTKQE